MTKPSPDRENKGQKIQSMAQELRKYMSANGKCLSHDQAKKVFLALGNAKDLAALYIAVTIRKSRGGKVKHTK